MGDTLSRAAKEYEEIVGQPGYDKQAAKAKWLELENAIKYLVKHLPSDDTLQDVKRRIYNLHKNDERIGGSEARKDLSGVLRKYIEVFKKKVDSKSNPYKPPRGFHEGPPLNPDNPIWKMNEERTR